MKRTTLILGILGFMAFASCAECEIEEDDQPSKTEKYADTASGRPANDTLRVNK